MKYSALIGNSVEHSISPKLFELLANKIGIEYSHIKIDVPKKESLPKIIKALCDLKFVGFNITCPYKINMFNLLDENECDNEALKIHSVNTIVISGEQVKGYNTDGKAAIMAIKHFYNLSESDKVVILGAGGVAYSILYEILKITKNVIIFNESLEMANQMCIKINNKVVRHDFESKDKLYNELKKATLIINATSVGMVPNIKQSLIDTYNIKNKKCYFDVVFNPWETEMLKQAKENENMIISGGYMLIYQAILALELWLNIKINITKEFVEEISAKMQKVLREKNDKVNN